VTNSKAYNCYRLW